MRPKSLRLDDQHDNVGLWNYPHHIYDLTGLTPVLLFSIPAPPGATVPVTGITGTSPTLTLKAGESYNFVVVQ